MSTLLSRTTMASENLGAGAFKHPGVLDGLCNRRENAELGCHGNR
jgi:hypothetical protein